MEITEKREGSLYQFAWLPTHYRHPREGGDPCGRWIPAFGAVTQLGG